MVSQSMRQTNLFCPLLAQFFTTSFSVVFSLPESPCRFEATPSGRLLNRFSSDLAAVDTEVMDELYTMVDNAATFIAIVVVIIASYWTLLVVMVPVVALSVGLGWVYQRTSQGSLNYTHVWLTHFTDL